MRKHPLREESGFTIIEVMVAITLLLVGVLGTVKIVDAGNKLSTTARARQTATNLARQMVETSRSIDYGTLVDGTIIPTLQAQPSLGGDSNGALAGWQLTRGTREYTIDVHGCEFDSRTDKVRDANPSPNIMCADSPAFNSDPVANPKPDRNPDDFREVVVTVTWHIPGIPTNCATGSLCISQTTLVPNPSGGLGPTIISVTHNPPDPVTTGTTVVFTVNLKSAADNVTWSADDGQTGSATVVSSTGSKQWTFPWTFNSGIGDGVHAITIQAFLLGIAGQPFSAQVQLNLHPPRATPTTALPNVGVDSRLSTIAEFAWSPNADGDIVGYKVYRATVPGTYNMTDTSGNAVDPMVCQTVTALTCFDASPPSVGPVSYYVVAFDTPAGTAPNYNTFCGINAASLVLTYPTGALGAFPPSGPRPGCPSSPQLLIPDIVAAAGRTRPTFPGGTTIGGGISNGLPTVTWTQSATDLNNNPVSFYRIYRDASTPPAYSERYDATTSGGVTSYSDPNPGSPTTHNYCVTAVDSQFQESDPLCANAG